MTGAGRRRATSDDRSDRRRDRRWRIGGARSLALVVVAVARHQRWCCSSPATTRCRRSGRSIARRVPEPPQHRQHRQPRVAATTSPALAVAIGFRMNLFNIGVDGQYRVAAFAAAVVRRRRSALPGAAATSSLIIVVAMVVGALWAGIAGLLKVTRGVSEVISTIMLNAIADRRSIAYLLRKVGVDAPGSNNIGTKPIPESAPVPGISLIAGRPDEVYGFIVARRRSSASLYWFVLEPHPVRLRPARHRRSPRPPRSPAASTSSGWSSSRCCISGAVAGLVGMPHAARRGLRLRHDVPGRPRLHRHRHRAARPQQPGRHRLRRAAVGLPRPSRRNLLQILAGISDRDRRDHPGRHRALRRHRLRARPPLPASRLEQRRVGARAGRRRPPPTRQEAPA